MPSRAKPIDGKADVDIYRPFFIAGILSVLTAGCTLGAIALLGLAAQQSYTANAWTPYVLAHANSQLYGWVGFFIIGFSLQHHAPRQSKAKLFHRLSYWTLGLMATGIALRFAAEPLVQVNRSVWLPVGVFSCLLQTAAVGVYFAIGPLTRYKTGEPLAWQTKFVFASLFWLGIAAVVEPFAFAMSHASNRVDGIMFVAEYFAPYREIQFLGFVGMMIFGVASVKMHSCFGAQAPRRTLGEVGFYAWNVGLLARMAGWIVYFRAGMTPESGRLYLAGGLILALAAMAIVGSLRIFEPFDLKLPSHKFVRGAFAWLLVAGVLLVLEPYHLRTIGQPFSHAYLGGIRHAVTVGFISQMILGVGYRVIHRMNGLDDAKGNPLWLTFVLLNVGNAARVGLEIATDYTPAAFAPMGITGFIELTGLAIWGVYLMSIMIRARAASAPSSTQTPSEA